MNLILGLLILIFTIIVVELNDFKIVPILLGLHGALFAVDFILQGALIETIPFVLFSVILIPVVLFYFTTKTKTTEEQPLIRGWFSFGIQVVLVVLIYWGSFLIIFEGSLLLPLIFTGVYGLILKTDLRKTVASITILLNSTHQFIASFNLFIDILLLALSAILLVSLLYFAWQIFKIKGSMSTRDLKELRF